MKRIILVGNTAWSMIKFRKGLIKKLLSLDYNVYVVAPNDEHSQEIKDLGCKYIDIAIDNKGSNLIKDLKLIYDLKQIYDSIKPDLIIHYTIKPNIYGSFACSLSGIRSFAVVTGLGYTFINKTWITKIAKILYYLAFKFSDKVFFINNDDRKEFLNNNLVKNNKIIMIPGEGIDTAFFKNEKRQSYDKKFKFLLIARMLWDKGVGEYVEAAKNLKLKYENIEFGLLGYLDVENPKAISKETMNEWSRRGFIKFYGSTDDVKSFISKSNCIVLPSYREGISMTLLESASMQVPLIATNVTGCKEVIDDGVSGFLCKVKNASDLADKMEKMALLSDDQRKEMGERGREKIVCEFDENIVIQKYLDTIDDVMNKNELMKS